MTQIKGIKVNNTSYDLNLSKIGSHLESPNGTDYVVTVDDNGNVFGKGGTRTEYGSGATGGSTVTVTPESIANGVKVATITVDGTAKEIYAPSGSTGAGSTVAVSAIATEGTEIATVTVDGTETKLYAPTAATTNVEVAPETIENGIKVATITVDGTAKEIYAPSASTVTPTTVEVAPETIENGIKVATITVDGTAKEIYAPSGSTGAGSTLAELTSVDGKEYLLCVEDDGTLFTKEKIETPEKQSAPVDATKDIYIKKFFINSVYCGGDDADDTSINYCSHNFVELSNCTNNDINLDGMSLQYSNVSGSKDWKVLPLSGTIKAGSTFLVRGAQCSSDITKINVDHYDQEWYVGKELIKFSTKGCKLYLVFSTTACSVASPWPTISADTAAGTVGYIDLIALGNSMASDAEGGAAFASVGANYLYKKYYALDPSAKAVKARDKRKNSTDWTYVDLTKEDGESVRSNEIYAPKASWEGKTLFYDKTDLDLSKPSMITCTFGIQATDNGEGATRCFNWVTHTLDESYIWISTDKNDWGTAHKAFEEGDKRGEWEDEIYNRKAQPYSNNTTFIVNKFIISGLTGGTYYYIAGKKNVDGTPDTASCTDVRSFVVKTDTELADGFSFVQTTDQQGFMWDEYEVWKAAAKLIGEEDTEKKINFMLNTGDMTQDGNRIYEWLDYFNAKGDYLNNMVEMATIGNNDLSLRDLTAVSNGDDAQKLWLENINFFYTFEIDKDNKPYFDVTYNKTTTDSEGVSKTEEVTETYFIPSLYSFNYGKVHFMCLNSEIKTTVEETDRDINSQNALAGYGFGANNYGNFYPQIKEWCETDLTNNTGQTWTIAYMHEMPFTILTSSTTIDRGNDVSGMTRPGSSINTNLKNNYEKYWFSEFAQTHGIKLVLGGHKHTQATSWPLLENVSGEGENRTVNSMMPIIVVNSETLSEFSGATSLVTYTGTTSKDESGNTIYEVDESGNTTDTPVITFGCKVCAGKKYPNTWFTGSEIGTSYTTLAKLCEFKMESDLAEGTTPVIYAMSQSTGYKHTSNRELASQSIPWLHYYFPETDAHKANSTQKMPMYTIWNVGTDKIEGSVRGVFGVFDSGGLFNVQAQGAKVRNGLSTADGQKAYKDSGSAISSEKIRSINALSSTIAGASALTSTTTIIVK